MDLQSQLNEFLDVAKRAKEMAVKEEPDHVANATIAAYRDDLVGHIMTSNSPKSVGAALLAAAFGWRAEAFVIINELCVTKLEVNPITGEAIEDGDARVLFENYPEYKRNREVARSLSYVAVDKTGERIYGVTPYVVEGNEAIWLDPEEYAISLTHPGGLDILAPVFDHMFSRDYLVEASGSEENYKTFFESELFLEEEVAMDVAFIKLTAETKTAKAISLAANQDDTERIELVRAALQQVSDEMGDEAELVELNKPKEDDA